MQSTFSMSFNKLTGHGSIQNFIHIATDISQKINTNKQAFTYILDFSQNCNFEMKVKVNQTGIKVRVQRSLL